MTLEEGLVVMNRAGQEGVTVTRGQQRVYVRMETPDRCYTYLVEERVCDLVVLNAH